MLAEQESLHEYQPILREWDRYASIRSRPRRFILDIEEHYFPVSRQPVCVHPLVLAHGSEAIKYILVQTAYKFMHEIAVLETEMVNVSAARIANDRFKFKFPINIRHDALTVIIDEAYHASVALDYMRQVEEKTKIIPLAMPSTSPNYLAIEKVHQKLPADLHMAFELMAVCISEHTLTKELINIGKEAELLKSFSNVMADHVLDEGRHAKIFAHILQIFWASFSEQEKNLLGMQLPFFIIEYLDTQSQKEFDQLILASLNFTKEEIKTILNDTYITSEKKNLKDINPIIPNIIKLLTKTKVLNHKKTLQAFQAANLIH